jgi:IclR family transcriptional regulator, KDG regulon repressor
MTRTLNLHPAPRPRITDVPIRSVRSADAARTAVDKAFELLASFPGGGTTVGVSELARTSALSKSTVFRLLTAMERNGFVERCDGRYRLGRRLYDIGAQVYEPRPGSLHELLSPVMASLYERSRETVHLGVLLDGEVALLGRLHGRRTTPHALRLGARFPAHCSAMGKAMLAHNPDAAGALLARGLTAHTPRTIVSNAEFRAELRRVREGGIAVSDQEARAGLTCVAIPLLDAAKRPTAALAIAGPSRGFDVRQHAATLRSVAAEAERLVRLATRVECRYAAC